MNRFTVAVSDKDYLQKAVEFIEKDLAAKKVSKKNIIKTTSKPDEYILICYVYHSINLYITISARAGLMIF